MSTAVTLTVPAAKVSSTLTNFVIRVSLADMPADWWADVASDGADIKVFNSTPTAIPFDLVAFDYAAQTGNLFFKATLTTAATVFTVEVVDGATAPAVTDATGRNAVWVDYDAVVDGVQPTVNRTGGSNPTLTGTVPIAEPLSQMTMPATTHQGIAADASGNWYAIDTDTIRKYDSSWSLLATRTGAAAATGIGGGVNHLGDGAVIAGELWLPIEIYPSGPYAKQYLTVWNLSDLSFNRSYDISAQGHEASGLCLNPVDGLIYVTAYTGTNAATNLYQYNATTGAYVGSLTTASIASKQGITVWDGAFWITSGSVGTVCKLSLDGATLTSTSVGSSSSGASIEGIQAVGDRLYVLFDPPSTLVEFALPGTNDWMYFDAANYYKVTVPKRTAWTMGTTFQRVRYISLNRGILSYSANGGTDANRATMAARLSNDKYAVWNSTDSWLDSAEAASVAFTPRRLHHTQNGTTDRKVWVNAVSTTDTTVSQRPASTGDTLFIGAEDTDGAEKAHGAMTRVYLRNGELTASWLAAEFASWESPSTFYDIAYTPPTGPVLGWWDGSARQGVTDPTWWDGSARQPVTVLGWWDGSAIQPLKQL